MSDESTAVTIRLANLGDAQRIAVLSGQLGYPATEEAVRQRLHAVLQEGRHAVFVAELSNGHVVGWIHLHALPLLVAGRRTEVWGLVVDEDHRHSGIGRRLMQQAERWARQQGCSVVYLHTNVVREEAHRFYELIGYEKIKTSLVFRREL